MYKVYDLETQTNVHNKRKASPWHPDNYIVAVGWKNQGDRQNSWIYNKDRTEGQLLTIEEDVTLLVGFNLKFDLLWQWDNPDLKAFFKRGGKIWDCQYAEYLLEGQNPKFHYCALNDVAPRYGGTKKIDEVKILWDNGVQTSDIPKDLLIDYLVGTPEEDRNAGDIGNTEKCFLGQLKRAVDDGMLTAIQSRMDALCALTEMEWNGLFIDMDEAKRQLANLKAELAEVYTELETYIPELPEGLEFNWNSRIHKSCWIFGGTVKYQKQAPYIDLNTGELARKKKTVKMYILEGGEVSDIPETEPPPDNVLRYQSGKNKGRPKTKNVSVPGELKVKYQDYYFTFPGYVQGDPSWQTSQRDAKGDPLYTTREDVISTLEHSGVPFCITYCKFEALGKEIKTYFIQYNAKKKEWVGMLTCVDPATRIIHHSLNNVATVTARLSSSDPNLQNIPRADKSEIKKMFSSRFGEDGVMIEADYSQLEVVVQGVLSGDKKLCEDLINKIDFHCKRVALQPKNNITYDEVIAILADEDHPEYSKWKAIRTAAKIFSFQRAYGAGAALIAASTGMTVEEVEELIKAEEAEYPGVKQFNTDVEIAVNDSCTKFFDPVDERMYRRGYYTAPTGCKYHFRSYDSPDYKKARGVEDTFSPTEMKNYPVQGTGGEIVLGCLGRLWRHFVANDNYGGKALLTNTVHDCVWADSHNDVKAEVAVDIKRIMEDVEGWFAQFNIEIPVPFPVEVEEGPNMYDLKHVA